MYFYRVILTIAIFMISLLKKIGCEYQKVRLAIFKVLLEMNLVPTYDSLTSSQVL